MNEKKEDIDIKHIEDMNFLNQESSNKPEEEEYVQREKAQSTWDNEDGWEREMDLEEPFRNRNEFVLRGESFFLEQEEQESFSRKAHLEEDAFNKLKEFYRNGNEAPVISKKEGSPVEKVASIEEEKGQETGEVKEGEVLSQETLSKEKEEKLPKEAPVEAEQSNSFSKKKVPLLHRRNMKKKERKDRFVANQEETGSSSNSRAYAGFWLRVSAFLIDFFVVWGTMQIIFYFLPVKQFIRFHVSSEGWSSILSEDLFFIMFFLSYSAIFAILNQGQSLGKFLLGIRVVPDMKENLAIFDIFVREIVGKYIFLKLPFLFIFMVFSKKKHSFFDYLSDTSVIKE